MFVSLLFKPIRITRQQISPPPGLVSQPFLSFALQVSISLPLFFFLMFLPFVVKFFFSYSCSVMALKRKLGLATLSCNITILIFF